MRNADCGTRGRNTNANIERRNSVFQMPSVCLRAVFTSAMPGRVGCQTSDIGELTTISLRDDAVCANGKRNDDVTVNDEKNTIFFGDIKVENLVAMPEHAREFMTAQRRMPPVR